MRFLLIILFFSSCASPIRLIERAIKKDPEILKKVVQADVQYVRDTLIVQNNGRIDTIYRDVIHETKIVEIQPERTRKEERLDAKLYKEQIKRFSLENDTLKAFIKKLEAETKLLKEKANVEKENARKLKRENRNNTVKWLLNNWWLILLLIVVTVLLIRLKIFSWLRSFAELVMNKREN